MLVPTNSLADKASKSMVEVLGVAGAGGWILEGAGVLTVPRLFFNAGGEAADIDSGTVRCLFDSGMEWS